MNKWEVFGLRALYTAGNVVSWFKVCCVSLFFPLLILLSRDDVRVVTFCRCQYLFSLALDAVTLTFVPKIMITYVHGRALESVATTCGHSKRLSLLLMYCAISALFLWFGHCWMDLRHDRQTYKHGHSAIWVSQSVIQPWIHKVYRIMNIDGEDGFSVWWWWAPHENILSRTTLLRVIYFTSINPPTGSIDPSRRCKCM